MSTMIPLLLPLGVRKQPNHSLTPAEAEALAAPPSPLSPSGRREEGRPRMYPRRGHPPSSPSGHPPLKERGVTDGEAQCVRLPKEPRRRMEGSEAQREWQSLKGVSYGAHCKGTSSKTPPTAPQTNPYICHMSCQTYI